MVSVSRIFPRSALRGMRFFSSLVLTLLLSSSCNWGTSGDVLTARAGVGQDGGGEVDAGTPCIDDGGTAWPVRFLIGIEQRGNMCLIDPPGSTGSGGTVCDLASQGVTIPADFRPRRSTAVESFLGARQGDVQAAVVGWARWPYPFGFANSGESLFKPPTSPSLTTGLRTLQAELGSANDLQRALTFIRDQLDAELMATVPDVRARTRYSVVLMSSGIPFPRCAANDALPQYATPSNPVGIWADDLVAPQFFQLQNPECYDAELPGVDWCTNQFWRPGQLEDGGVPDAGAGYVDRGSMCTPIPWLDGVDYNQTAQLTALVDEIVALQQTYAAGEIKVNTVLTFDQTQTITCGVACAYLFHPWRADRVRSAGADLLQQLAAHGGGDFIDPPDLLPIDLNTQLPRQNALNRCP